MKLEIICPTCWQNEDITVNTFFVEKGQTKINYKCDICTYEGVLEREPERPSIIVRIIKKIKRTWSGTK